MGQTLGRHAGDKENQPLDNGEKVTPAGTWLCLIFSTPIRARAERRHALYVAGNPLPDVVHLELSQTQLQSRRLILVGDVHGCGDELDILLHKCHFQQGADVLIFNGDVVNKGPKSTQVISKPPFPRDLHAML